MPQPPYLQYRTLLKLCKIMAIPVLLSGCEKWTSLKHHGRRIEAAEMKLLRPVAEFAVHDQRGNQEAS